MNDLDRSVVVRQLLMSADVDAGALVTANTIDQLPVFGVRVDVGQAADLWHRLRAQHEETGLWPFLSDDGPMEWARRGSDTSASLNRLVAALAASPSEVLDELIGRGLRGRGVGPDRTARRRSAAEALPALTTVARRSSLDVPTIFPSDYF